jgi:hypothetical protein
MAERSVLTDFKQGEDLKLLGIAKSLGLAQRADEHARSIATQTSHAAASDGAA